MEAWLSTYNEFLGMHHAAIITAVFGAFCVSFVVLTAWPKLVRDFGPAGGMIAAALIIGTFWLLNHKLPGFGINPDQIKDAAGNVMQYGLIHQGMRGAAPWIDMGFAIASAFVVFGLLNAPRGRRLSDMAEVSPRILTTLAGGAVGGGIAGLIGYTGATLFN